MRVVQISDTHIAAATGVAPTLRRVLDLIDAEPPDLVVHTGDIVWEDPDHVDDRWFARDVFAELPCPLVAIPGNHDVGFFEQSRFGDRRTAFCDTWGDDRFVVDDPSSGWRLIGVDVYAIGGTETDEWLAHALTTDRPIGVFVHQPLTDDLHDGWQLPEPTRRRIIELLAAGGVRILASGHRHCGATLHIDECTHVWAPSTTLTGGTACHGGDPSPGFVEFAFRPSGEFAHQIVHVR